MSSENYTQSDVRRAFVKSLPWIVGGVVGGVAADRVFTYFFGNKDNRNNPKYQPLFYEGRMDSPNTEYSVERIGESEFEIIDQRPGNSLPPDRESYLHQVALHLQDKYGCLISNVTDSGNHSLFIKVENPQCLFDARLKDQIEK